MCTPALSGTFNLRHTTESGGSGGKQFAHTHTVPHSTHNTTSMARLKVASVALAAGVGLCLLFSECRHRCALSVCRSPLSPPHHRVCHVFVFAANTAQSWRRRPRLHKQGAHRRAATARPQQLQGSPQTQRLPHTPTLPPLSARCCGRGSCTTATRTHGTRRRRRVFLPPSWRMTCPRNCSLLVCMPWCGTVTAAPCIRCRTSRFHATNAAWWRRGTLSGAQR